MTIHFILKTEFTVNQKYLCTVCKNYNTKEENHWYRHSKRIIVSNSLQIPVSWFMLGHLTVFQIFQPRYMYVNCVSYHIYVNSH